MYGIVRKQGRGSWHMACDKIFDDKEKAEAVATKFSNIPETCHKVKCKVIYLGDSDDWSK